MGETVRVAAWMRALLACERLERAMFPKKVNRPQLKPEAKDDRARAAPARYAG